jgi:broad specificity phosphatase PhoE
LADETTIQDDQQVDVPDVPQDNGQQPNGDGQPQLPDDKKKELHGIVSKMILNKESEDNIKNVISYYNRKYTTSTPTTPVPEHQIVHTDEQNNDYLVGQAQNRLQGHIQNNAKEAAQEIYANEFSQATRDLANGKITVDQFKQARDNYVKNRVNVEQGNDAMVNQAKTDPYAQSIILKHTVKNNPQLGNEIKQDVALVSAKDRLGTNGEQIKKNLQGIKNGDLDVDLSNGQVIKPVGFWGSAINSLRDNLNAHSEFLWNKNHSDADIANKYLGEAEYRNPDEPVEVPKDNFLGKAGEFVGGNLPITGMGGTLAAAETLFPEGKLLKVGSLLANSAMVGTDMYMVGHANAMKQHFWENYRNGMSPEDAVKDARNKADYDATTDAAAGVAMGAVGSMGGMEAVKLSPEVRGFAKGLYNEGKNLLAYGTPEAAATGLINVASQEAKNAHNGTENNDGLSDAALAGVLLPYVMRMGRAGGNLVKSSLWNNIKTDIAKMPEGVVNGQIDNAVQTGAMNPNDANDFKSELTDLRKNDARIPIHVTDPEVRQQASELMDKYDEEKKKLDVSHDMNNDTIKARMKEIKDEYQKLTGTEPQDNIRTKKIDFDKVAVAKNILNEDIEKQNGDWTKSDINTLGAKGNPEQFLKEMAMQAHGITADGETHPLGSQEKTMTDIHGYSPELINAAKEAYPKESFQNKEVEGAGSDNPKTIIKKEAAPSSPEPDYLLSRHADTVKDEQGKVSGPNQSGLSSDGKRDANDLSNDVLAHSKQTGVPVKKVIHSDLERAMETGDKVADKTGAVSISDKNLRTWDIGDFDDTKDTEFKKVQNWFSEHPDEKTYNGDIEKFQGKKLGETLNEYAKRTIDAHKPYENEPASTMLIDHSNNMMIMDAYRKNGNVWDENAIKDYINAEKPEPATLVNKNIKQANPKITEAENNRQAELKQAGKPEISDFKELKGKELANSKEIEPEDALAKHEEITSNLEKLKKLINCLWT